MKAAASIAVDTPTDRTTGGSRRALRARAVRTGKKEVLIAPSASAVQRALGAISHPAQLASLIECANGALASRLPAFVTSTLACARCRQDVLALLQREHYSLALNPFGEEAICARVHVEPVDLDAMCRVHALATRRRGAGRKTDANPSEAAAALLAELPDSTRESLFRFDYTDLAELARSMTCAECREYQLDVLARIFTRDGYVDAAVDDSSESSSEHGAPGAEAGPSDAADECIGSMHALGRTVAVRLAPSAAHTVPLFCARQLVTNVTKPGDRSLAALALDGLVVMTDGRLWVDVSHEADAAAFARAAGWLGATRPGVGCDAGGVAHLHSAWARLAQSSHTGVHALRTGVMLGAFLRELGSYSDEVHACSGCRKSARARLAAIARGELTCAATRLAGRLRWVLDDGALVVPADDQHVWLEHAHVHTPEATPRIHTTRTFDLLHEAICLLLSRRVRAIRDARVKVAQPCVDASCIARALAVRLVDGTVDAFVAEQALIKGVAESKAAAAAAKAAAAATAADAKAATATTAAAAAAAADAATVTVAAAANPAHEPHACVPATAACGVARRELACAVTWWSGCLDPCEADPSDEDFSIAQFACSRF